MCDLSAKKIKLECSESNVLRDHLLRNNVVHTDVICDQSEGSKGDKLEADVSQSWFTTRDDKTMLQEKGHTWRHGQWTSEEVQILTSNITLYCNANNIKDVNEVIFDMSKDERKDFYRSVSKGLNRPLFSVYRRVIRMYDQKNHIGKYKPDEVQRLKELRIKFGNDWCAIGQALGRSASSVKDRCRLMKDTCNTGKWMPEEEERLAQVVYELSGAEPGQNVTGGLSWTVVAEKVITRTEKQCRAKWLNYLNWKQQCGKEWTRDDDCLLVQKLYDSNCSEENLVQWAALCADWSSARSPQWLRSKWWSLKRAIPNYNAYSFTELLKVLKESHGHTVPVNLGQPQSNQSNLITAVQVPVFVRKLESETAASTGEVEIEVQSGNPEAVITTDVSSDHVVVRPVPVINEANGLQSLFLTSQPGATAAQIFKVDSLQGIVLSGDTSLHQHITLQKKGETLHMDEEELESVIVDESQAATDDVGSVTTDQYVLIPTGMVSPPDGALIHMSTLSDPMLGSSGLSFVDADVERHHILGAERQHGK